MEVMRPGWRFLNNRWRNGVILSYKIDAGEEWDVCWLS